MASVDHRVVLVVARLPDRPHLAFRPDTPADRELYKALQVGDFDRWSAVSTTQIEQAGQQELLNWFIVQGAARARQMKPDWSTFVETYCFNSTRCSRYGRPATKRCRHRPRSSSHCRRDESDVLMTTQLRRYELFEDAMDGFLSWFPSVIAPRQQYGFEVLFAYANRERNEFTWAVRHRGDFETAELDAVPDRAAAFADQPARVKEAHIFIVEEILGPSAIHTIPPNPLETA